MIPKEAPTSVYRPCLLLQRSETISFLPTTARTLQHLSSIAGLVLLPLRMSRNQITAESTLYTGTARLGYMSPTRLELKTTGSDDPQLTEKDYRQRRTDQGTGICDRCSKFIRTLDTRATKPEGAKASADIAKDCYRRDFGYACKQCTTDGKAETCMSTAR